MNIKAILKKFWGYDSFRPLQEDIINAILSGNDTLALLPTGGGKSICFQVPALALDGICIVVSPLIALMKDQVENLSKVGIQASFLHSGMNKREIDITLENCVQGMYKFLYVSPERCKTDIFIERFKRMDIAFIAVDEAHCVSQWGYDFRPPYLELAQLRELKPNLNFLALTASATPDVEKDIIEKLAFKPEYKVYRKSFDRKNLVYAVTHTNDKFGRILYALQKTQGTAIIYVRNRKLTKEIALWLASQGISTDFYHAGLSHLERNSRQEKWKKGHTRVMVCTNAFGMGIDKDNVRLVLHYGLPDSLEAYYQEAGRAGRDEKKAFAVALVSQKDIEELQRNVSLQFPDRKIILQVYHALGNFFQIPIGVFPFTSFPFDIADFCNTYSLAPLVVIGALKMLQENDYLQMSDGFFQPSRLIFLQTHDELYKFMVANPKLELIIKALLRSYGGITDDYTKINEQKLARLLHINTNLLEKALKQLQNLNIIDYIQASDKPTIAYLQPRLDKDYIRIDNDFIAKRKGIAEQKLNGMLSYVNTTKCRSKVLLTYFGEGVQQSCGHCDYCLSIGKKESDIEIKNKIINAIPAEGISISKLKLIVNTEDMATKQIIRQLIEEGTLGLVNDVFKLNN